jgi:hydroxyacid-oxoacid transhydrogenase
VGYGEADIDALTRGTLVQARLLGNAPCPVDGARLADLFRGALAYW